VYDNVAYGLKARRVTRREIRERVTAALELVRLDGLESRRPEQLSGGQQQRVAVARALVIEPRVLLMDEPLSNLDAKLRVEMRMDIRRLQKRFQTTMIYVTHDQEEALAISDRIAVMELGRVVQVGTPWEIYHRPANPYAAGFIGVTNFFSCRLLKIDGRSETVTIDFQGKSLELPYIQSPGNGSSEREAEERVIVSMRPESLDIFEEGAEMPADFVGFRGTILESTFLGPVLRIAAEAESGERFQIEQNNPDYDDLIEEGSRITVGCPAREMTVFPEDG